MHQHELDEIARRVNSAAAEFSPSSRPTAGQVADAASVLRDMVQAAAVHGVRFAHFDGVADFPRVVLQLVQYRDEQH